MNIPDLYIKINKENIPQGYLSQFKRRTRSEVNTYELGYDYGLIMHYTQKAFSKNGRNTIDIVNYLVYLSQGSPYLGRTQHLSVSDCATVNKLWMQLIEEYNMTLNVIINLL